MVKSELPLKWFKMPAWQVNTITQPTCAEGNVRERSWSCLALTALGTGSRQLRKKGIQLKVNTRDTTSISTYESVPKRLQGLGNFPTSHCESDLTLCSLRAGLPAMSPQPNHGGATPFHRLKDCWVLKESCDLLRIMQLKSGRTRGKV